MHWCDKLWLAVLVPWSLISREVDHAMISQTLLLFGDLEMKNNELVAGDRNYSNIEMILKTKQQTNQKPLVESITWEKRAKWNYEATD